MNGFHLWLLGRGRWCPRRMALIGGLLTVVSVASAQNYQQAKFDKAIRNSNRRTVAQILEGRLPLEGNEAAFRAYFQNAFAEMTQLAALGDIANMRWAMYNQVRKAKNPAALKEFNRLALSAATTICKRNYHPAARYNMALVLGDLDQRLRTGYGSAAKPPVPLPDAVPVLLELLNDDQMIDAVKVAALVGLERHARLGLPASQRAPTIAAMLALLSAKEPPAGRTPEGHVWLRRRAADVLARIGQVGKSGEVVTALAAVIANQNSPIALRCGAACAFGQLKFASDTKMDTETLVTELSGLGRVALEQELSLARKRQQQSPSGSGGPGRRGSFDTRAKRGPAGAASDHKSTFPRRQLASRLRCVRTGLDAVKGRAKGRSKTLADQMVAQLNAALKLMENKQLEDNELMTGIAKVQAGVQEALQQASAAAPGTVEKPAPKRES